MLPSVEITKLPQVLPLLFVCLTHSRIVYHPGFLGSGLGKLVVLTSSFRGSESFPGFGYCGCFAFFVDVFSLFDIFLFLSGRK